MHVVNPFEQLENFLLRVVFFCFLEMLDQLGDPRGIFFDFCEGRHWVRLARRLVV